MRPCPLFIPALAVSALLSALLPSRAASATGPPAQPDLDVTYIAITPRLPSYYPFYTGGVGLPTDPNRNPNDPASIITLEQAQQIQHYHQPGEMVTFTAHVVNHGGLPTAPYSWAFKVDGTTIASGREDTGLAADAQASVRTTYTLKGFDGNPNGYTFQAWDLAKGTHREYSAQWPWQDGPHKVRFEVTPDPSTPAEISTRNNAREDWTDAAAFFITVRRGNPDPSTGIPTAGYNGFRLVQNFTDSGTQGYPAGPGSYSFEDWLQYHVDLMHDKFAKSVYPTAPQGILQHIRIDEIVIIDDNEGRNGPGEFRAVNGFDSSWPFDLYPASNAKTKDWGLIHEWGHQLGLIDIYNLDSIPSENYTLDFDGYPVGLGFVAHQQGMMRNHGDTNFSEFSAIGMNTQVGRRRGYYGDFQYLMPHTNRIRVLDTAGNPVSNAEVQVFQAKPYPQTPTFSGTTDADGYFTLPNRAANHLTTEYKPGAATLYTQQDSPFATVDVVGGHNVFQFLVRAGGKREFFFLDVTDFVRAWAGSLPDQGPELATYIFRTHFPAPGAPAPPGSLSARMYSGVLSQLTWQPSPAPGVTGYRIYKAVEQEYHWYPLTTVDAATTSYYDSVNSRQMVRYAVTALTAAGESAFTNEVGLYAFADMRGLVEEPDGTILVADYNREQPIWLRPDLSPIETFGSVHNHLAAIDVAYLAGNRLAWVGFPGSYGGAGKAGVFVLPSNGMGQQYLSYNYRDYGSNVGEWRLPEGVSGLPNGSLVVTDSANHRVEVTDWGGYSPVLTFGEADLVHPIKTIPLPDGTFLTTDAGADKVQHFDASGNLLGTFATLTSPGYIARAIDGTIAVSQPGSHLVSLYDANGTPKGTIANAPDGQHLFSPKGLAFSQAGDLLVAESGRYRVVRLPVSITPPLTGDTDGDGKITMNDAALALKFAAGLVIGKSDYVTRADIITSKVWPGVNIDDVIAIAKQIPRTTDQ